MKPKKIQSLLQNLTLSAGLLASQSPESISAQTPESDTTAGDISYGIRQAIQRKYKHFDITAQGGIFFPQNKGSVTQNISNLEFHANIPRLIEIGRYTFPISVHGNFNLLFAENNQRGIDDFDMQNEVKLAFAVPRTNPNIHRPFDFHLEALYFDQINFDNTTTQPEQAFTVAARISYDSGNIFQANLEYFDFFLNRIGDNEQIIDSNTFRGSFQINATQLNIEIPFGIRFEFTNSRPQLESERVWGFMTNVILLTSETDYEVDFSVDHPVLGTSYSYKSTDKKEKPESNPDTADKPETFQCPDPTEIFGNPFDLTNGNILAQKIQEQLKCNPLVNYTLNLDQVEQFKQAAGSLHNFTLNILRSKQDIIKQGRELYSMLKQIPRSGGITLKPQGVIDSLAKFLVLTDQAVSHLHGVSSLQLSDLEKRFMSGLTRRAQHYFDTSKTTHLLEQALVYGSQPHESIPVNQVAILGSNIFRYKALGATEDHILDRTLQFVGQVSDGINLDVPFQNIGLSHQMNARNNFDINEMIRLFEPILLSGVPIKLNHHNSIEIEGFGKPIIEGINISNISSNGMLKLTRLSEYKSQVEITDNQIILHFEMITDATQNPPKYTVTFTKSDIKPHDH